MSKQKNFGWGYSLIIHSMLTYFIFGAFTTSGMNIWVPAFCGLHGWDHSVLLSMATVASLVGVVGSILFGELVVKKGARIIISITLIGCGIAIMLFGFVPNVIGYLLCMIIFNFAGHGFCNIGSNAVIANWYPRKKGFVLGITTMGLPMASFLFVPILSKTLGGLGLKNGFLTIGICVVIFGVISWFWIRNTPEEVGLLPDNGKFGGRPPMEGQEFKSAWPMKRLLRNRTAWMIILAYGLLFLVTQGMVSQTVSYLVERGFEQAMAVKMLSISAAIGIVGSFIWGILDDKLGTKKASVIYTLWYFVTFLLLASALNRPLVLAGVVMLGASMGGIGNLMPSMMMTAYGPREFPAVSRMINTLGNIVRSMSFLVIAVGLKVVGTYAKTGWILMGITAAALIFILCIKSEGEKQHAENSN